MNAILERFSKELDDLSDLFMRHYTIKGDGWKDCDVNFLRHKIIEEIQEYLHTEQNSVEEKKELLDVILVALMLSSRISIVKHINVDPLVDIITENRRVMDEKRAEENKNENKN